MKDPGSQLSRFSTLASFLLLKDQAGREPLYDEKVTKIFLGSMSVGAALGTHFFSELRKERKFERAFFVGKILVESGVVRDGDSMLQISQSVPTHLNQFEALYNGNKSSAILL